MARLHVVSDLPVDPETAWSLFESEEFEQRLEGQANLRCEVLSTEQDGAIVVRNLRYRSLTDLPKMVAKALGSQRLTYEQVNRYDAARSTLDWVVKLPVLSDRVDVSGTTVISPSGTGCRRVVDGNISIRVRLVGSTIEKAVVGEFERSMTRAVDIVRAMIDERGLAK